jgi:phosphate:Na+ symporter
LSLANLSQILGGVGLFLLGMVLLTDGLKSVAGDSLRIVLSRFTGGPGRAFLTGIGITCLVQSSSATVLATIGFVSAGLLSFPQAVGVVLGAAVGTTSTGWIVSGLGLKFSVSIVAMPLVGLGALARLLTSGRLASAGIAFAGFGLIFIGIDVLRDGMEGLGTLLDPARFGGDHLLGRLLLIAVGIAMTVIVQSSSAAVVMTLAAFDAGTITIDQAGALVIGQSAGTAVTAAIATIGASVSARRTALAHIIFNVAAAALAFMLLPAFLLAARSYWVDGAISPIAIAAFHTTFTIATAVLVLPFTRPYARLISKLLRERGPILTSRLDPTVRSIPQVAVEAARLTLIDIARVVLGAGQSTLANVGPAAISARLEAAESALIELRQFLTGVGAAAESESAHRGLVSTLHAMDHLSRLVGVLRARHHVPDAEETNTAFARLGNITRLLDAWLGSDHGAPPGEIETLARQIAELRRRQRISMLERTAAGHAAAGQALVSLDAMRWLDRIAYHLWRIAHHLQTPAPAAAATGEEAPEPQ